MKRKVIEFIVNDEVVAEVRRNLCDNQIDEYCWIISKELEVSIYDVDFKRKEIELDTSDIDVNEQGAFNWLNPQGLFIEGVKLPFELGSDAHLDAIVNNSLIDYLQFID